jgi:hypothetical protein
MDEPSFLEKASSNIGMSLGATLVAASASTYLAPFFPVLMGAFANGRYQKRVQKALNEINERLNENEEAVRNISDNQFKLLGEIISTTIHTTNEDKIELLKNAVINSISFTDIEEHEASLLSRALRDVTVREYRFLNDNIQYKEISVFNPPLDDHQLRDKQVVYLPTSDESQLLSGLVNLGLIHRGHSGFGGGDFHYSYTKIGRELVSICQ